MSENLYLTNLMAFLLSVIFIKWLWGRLDLYYLSMKLPGPISFPFVGSLIFGIKFINSKNTMTTIWDYYIKYSGLFRVWILSDLYVLLIEPEDVESALCNSGVAKPEILSSSWSESMGNGLFILSNNKELNTWKAHRKIIAPSLTQSVIKRHFKSMLNSCDRLVENIDKICDKGFIDIETVLCRNCSNIVTETLFDAKFEFCEGKMDDLIESVAIIGMSLFDKLSNPMLWFKPVYRFTNVYKKEQKAGSIMKKFAKEIYDRGLNEYRKKTIEADFEGFKTINVLMKANIENRMTREEVIDEIITLWTGASDSTGNSLCFLIIALAINKKCQEKAYQEVQSFFKYNDTLEWDDLDKFPYIDMCMKESMRIFPPGPGYFRYTTKAFRLKSKNITIPRGTNLALFSYLTMRDPKYWNEPLIFNPERFTKEETSRRHPFSYYPFGGGPRKCIGSIYGRLLTKLYAIYIIKNFELHSDWKIEDIPLRFDFDCRSLWGYCVKIKRRI